MDDWRASMEICHLSREALIYEGVTPAVAIFMVDWLEEGLEGQTVGGIVRSTVRMCIDFTEDHGEFARYLRWGEDYD